MRVPDLHRADVVPEWETIPPEDWNVHQQRAAETNGWDTPGNRSTAKGLVCSAAGLTLIYVDTPASVAAGTVLLGVGRVYDLKDGRDAAKTGTKSPKGEALDAGVDALLSVAAAIVMDRKGMMPRREADKIIGLVALKTVASGVGKARNREIHPAPEGKHGTLALWVGAGSYCLERAAEHFDRPKAAVGWGKVGKLALNFGTELMKPAVNSYIKDAFAQ